MVSRGRGFGIAAVWVYPGPASALGRFGAIAGRRGRGFGIATVWVYRGPAATIAGPYPTVPRT